MRLILATILLATTGVLFSTFAQTLQEKGKITHDVMVGASGDIPLKAGQVVQILKHSGQVLVVSAQKPDGSSGIFQVDVEAVQLIPADPAPSPSTNTAPVVATQAPVTSTVGSITSPSTAVATAATPQPLSGLASDLAGHLVLLQDGDLKDFDASTLQGVKYWAIYFAASWCPDCVPVTPELSRFYRSFKANHSNFELILVCHDKTADAMSSYMKTADMPWPALRFTDSWNTHLWPLSHIARGLPNLVLVDETGKVLSQTYQGDTPQDPMKVVDDIKTMVPEITPQL